MRDFILDALGARAGYIKAELGTRDGTMHSTTAVGLMVRDPDFVAECELNGQDAVYIARRIVSRWQEAFVQALRVAS